MIPPLITSIAKQTLTNKSEPILTTSLEQTNKFKYSSKIH